jgi:hypothetical protein
LTNIKNKYQDNAGLPCYDTVIMKKNICIIGDSWAHTPVELFTDQDHSLLDWPEFSLRARGHQVWNRGWRASGIHYQWHAARAMIEHGKRYPDLNIDVIIWFHTEILKERDWVGDLKRKRFPSYDRLIENYIMQSYERMQEIHRDNPQITWAIIGGHCAISEQYGDMLNWADYKKDNWRAEITGKPLPECHSLEFLPQLREAFDLDLIDLDTLERELTRREQIQEACRDRTKFWDGVHPSAEPYRQLTAELIRCLNL